MEGACVMGVSAATLGEITFKNGRAQQDNFNGYQVDGACPAAPREVRVQHRERGDYGEVPMGGVGEPGVPPVLPRAVQCDLRRKPGKRMRQLPIGDHRSRPGRSPGLFVPSWRAARAEPCAGRLQERRRSTRGGLWADLATGLDLEEWGDRREKSAGGTWRGDRLGYRRPRFCRLTSGRIVVAAGRCRQ